MRTIMLVMVACMVQACTGAQATQGAEMACDVVRKVCLLASGGCALVPTSGGESE